MVDLLEYVISSMFSCATNQNSCSSQVQIHSKKDSRGPRVGSEWGTGSQELVPLRYACIYWLGYDWLLLQADRLLAQSYRIDELHADTEHKNAKQCPPTNQVSQNLREGMEME